MGTPDPRRRATTRRALPAALAVAVVLVVSAGAAGATTSGGGSSSGGSVSVPQGAATVALSSGTVVGDTAADTPIDVSFILRARNLSDLETRVQHGWSRPYLTTSQFAATYGQPLKKVRAVESYLAYYGITTHAYADGLDISATGTAAEFDRALQVSLQDYRVRTTGPRHGGAAHLTTVHGSLRDPRLPSSISNSVLAILGLSNYAPFTSQAVRATGHRITRSSARAGTGIPAGNGLAPQDFESRYQLSRLESHGAKGQGETIGIVTLASIDPVVPLGFWNTVLGLNSAASRLKLVPVDGGAGPPSLDAGSDETDLDVEQSGAIAPKAHLRVYEAPNTDPGFADAFFAAASDNLADTVSTSWGESETFIQVGIANATEPAAYAQVFDQAFLELAAQGQSDFAASGDSGAYDALADTFSTNLSTDNPSDSPYITSAGGTTLPGAQTYGVTASDGTPTGTETVTVPAERAWGWDYLWPLYRALGAFDETTAATSIDGGGGGGYSVIEPRPTYQRDVSAFNDRKYLTGTVFAQFAPGMTLPTDFSYAPTPTLKAGSASTGRAQPDLSTNADPQTGYAVYDPSFFDRSFSQYGGTSFVSPQLNGATAVIDSFVHHRVGLWNPEIYSFARNTHSPFTPLNSTAVFSGKTYLSQTDASGHSSVLPGNFSNDNLFYTGKSGALWNPATGLGTPNLTKLANDFAQIH